MTHKAKRLILWCVLSALIIVSCTTAPAPLPEPRVFLSPVSTQYLPFAARPATFGRGGALTYSGIAGCQDAARIGAKWLYNWSAFPPICDGMASLPMTWMLDLASCPELGNGNPILNLNEPSNASAWGRVITPELAIALTRKLKSCYPSRQLTTPAEFGGQGGADTTAWLTPWWNGYVAKYGTAPAEIMATHCYAGRAQVCIDSLKRDIAWANERHLPVLLTEWGIVPKWAGGEDIAMREADILLHWLQQQPEIIGEAFFSTRIRGDEAWWFGGPTTATIDMQSGALTDWGKWYAAN